MIILIVLNVAVKRYSFHAEISNIPVVNTLALPMGRLQQGFKGVAPSILADSQ